MTTLDHLDTITARDLYKDLRIAGDRKGYRVEMLSLTDRRTVHVSGTAYHYVLDIRTDAVTVTRTHPTSLQKDYEPSDSGVVEATIDLIRALIRH